MKQETKASKKEHLANVLDVLSLARKTRVELDIFIELLTKGDDPHRTSGAFLGLIELWNQIGKISCELPELYIMDSIEREYKNNK